jgi:SAM-dependent methyltransferase
MNEESSLYSEAPAFSTNVSRGSSQLDQWLFQSITRYIKGKVLEVGSDCGNISALFSLNGIALRISDPAGHQCETLQKRFAGDLMIKGIHRINLAHEGFATEYAPFLERFDTLVSLSSTKFNFSDPAIWHNAKQLLRERGRLIILLPAPAVPYQSSADGLEEWYRWTRHHISKWLGKDGEMITIQSFGIADIPRSAETGSTIAVPFFQAREETSFYQTGLYVIVAARKL